MRRRGRRAVLWTVVLLGVLGGSILVASTLGAARIPVRVTAGVLLEGVGIANPWAAEATEAQREIVRAIRLPRILLAALVGAALAMVGTGDERRCAMGWPTRDRRRPRRRRARRLLAIVSGLPRARPGAACPLRSWARWSPWRGVLSPCRARQSDRSRLCSASR
jgi:hypothetical protein